MDVRALGPGAGGPLRDPLHGYPSLSAHIGISKRGPLHNSPLTAGVRTERKPHEAMEANASSWPFPPSTPGEQRRVAVPPEFMTGPLTGEGLCATGDIGHGHGECHSGPFKVVLVSMYREYKENYGQPIARVYSSETNTWSSLISIEASHNKCSHIGPSTLVGNVLYWPLHNWADNILEFDLDTLSLTVIKGPPGIKDSGNFQIIQAEDGTVGIAMLSRRYHDIQMWQRKVNSHGVGTWVMWKTIGTHNIPELRPPIEGEEPWVKFILGYDEDTDGIILYVKHDVYMVQLKSMQSRKLWEPHHATLCNSFNSFYMPGDCSSLVLTL